MFIAGLRKWVGKHGPGNRISRSVEPALGGQPRSMEGPADGAADRPQEITVPGAASADCWCLPGFPGCDQVRTRTGMSVTRPAGV